jgi:hypothetical protein
MATFELRPNRVAQAYGYLACLIALIVFVVGMNQVVEHGLDYASPDLAANNRYGYQGYNSFEDYKINYLARHSAALRGVQIDQSNSWSRNDPSAMATAGIQADSVAIRLAASTKMPTDEQLRTMFDDDQKRRLQQASYWAKRGLAGGIQAILIALIIFAIHWRWLQRLSRVEEGVPGLL